MKELITNEEYFRRLVPIKEQLKALREQGVRLAADIIGQTMFKNDLYFCTAINRCLYLIDGFSSMITDRNLTCAGVLVRIQLDNCMRTYAGFIIEDKESIVDCLIDGKQINKEKNQKGAKLSDAYLKEALTKYDPQFKRVYEHSSGYVHLSSKAFFQTVTQCEDHSIKFQVGHELPEKYNSILLEVAAAFIHFVQLLYKLLHPVVESKQCNDDSPSEKSTVPV